MRALYRRGARIVCIRKSGSDPDLLPGPHGCSTSAPTPGTRPAGHPFVVNSPGEFEAKDVFAYSIAAPTKGDEKTAGKENLIFRIEAEEMRIAHLGALDRPLTNDELSQLENIDILMIPVGGGRVMSPKVAAEVLAEIEPRIVIPMTHAIENVKEKLASVDDFCKALGACKRENTAKYKVTRKDLPEEDMMMVVLER